MNENKNLQIRVLQIVFVWGSGGVERLITNYVQNLQRIRFDVLVLQKYEYDSIFLETIYDKGGKVEAIGEINGNIFQRISQRFDKIKKYCKENKYDIIHVNGGTCLDITYALAAKRGSPSAKVIMHSHADNVEPPSVFKKKVFHHLFKFLMSNIPDGYLSCSKNSLNWMFPKFRQKSKPSSVIFNGIDLELFQYRQDIRKEYRDKLGITDDFVIGTVGRFAPQKNPQFLISILQELLFMESKTKLIWVGDGPMFHEIKQKVKQLGLVNNVIFLGATKNVLPYYLAMDVFVLTSVYEGLGIVNVEAQATGLRCVVSDVVPPEAQVTPLLEYMSLSKSSKEWAQKIYTLNHGYERIDHGTAVRVAGYDRKGSVCKLEQYYHSLLNE